MAMAIGSGSPNDNLSKQASLGSTGKPAKKSPGLISSKFRGINTSANTACLRRSIKSLKDNQSSRQPANHGSRNA